MAERLADQRALLAFMALAVEGVGDLAERRGATNADR